MQLPEVIPRKTLPVLDIILNHEVLIHPTTLLAGGSLV